MSSLSARLAPESPRSDRPILALAALLALLFTAGTMLGPPAGLLDPLYSAVCHQLPERSLEGIGGVQAVCARCSGLYLGGSLGLVGAALFGVGWFRPRRVWLIAAVLPTLIDVTLPRLGLVGLAELPRFLLSLPAGFLLALFLAVGLSDLVVRRRSAPTMGDSLDG